MKKFFCKFNLLLVGLLIIIFSSFTFAFAANVSDGESYTVKKGDVLWRIGRDFGISWQELAKGNEIKNPNLIFPGQKIHIPTLKAIDILTTNDFHGALEGGNEAGAGKLAAYVDYYREQNPAGTLVLDAGDAFQGTSLSNLHRGKPVVEMMNAIGYDAMAVGNHEFDWGIETILQSLEPAQFELVSANIYENDQPVNWLKPYTIIERKGLKIAVIGLTTPETAITTSVEYVKDYQFKDPAEIVNRLVPEIKAKGIDMIILLGHIPGEQDLQTKQISGELAELAKDVQDIDGLIGGHSHNPVSGIVNGIPVIEAYKNGRMLGHITLVYNTVKQEVVEQDAELIEVRKGDLSIVPDGEIQAMVQRYKQELEPLLSQVLGKAVHDLKRGDNNESAIGNWITDVMRETTGSQVAFFNEGGIRDDLLEGDITVGHLYKVLPFDNTIVAGKMTGAQIKAVLEQSVTLYKGMLQISGLNFTYDSTKPEGERVGDMTLMDGNQIDMEATYKIATNDFLAGGQDGFVTFKDIQWENNYGLLRDVLMGEIKENGEISGQIEGRIIDIIK